MPAAGGAVAAFGRHVVTFAANANTAAAVQTQLPQALPGQSPTILTSHVVGLCYWTLTGPCVMIASLADSTGEIAPPASVNYPDALGPRYDVLYK